MRELVSWWRETGLENRPWLILGKGPTFSRRDEFDLSGYNLISLNHAVREQPVDVAHIIDLDVVEDCADVLLQNARYVVMPRVPHVRVRPSLTLLEEFVDVVPVLRRLDDEGRLVWYNAETSTPQPGSPVVEVRHFSSEAVLSILGLLGVRHVRSLGVDGGASYSPAFASLDARTRLANGQPSFDVQFKELDRIAAKWGVDFEALVPPIRVFVGADETQLVPTLVLEHTIRRHTSRPVRVQSLGKEGIPMPRKRENRPRTGFSFARFRIPELCGYRGRAIYLDSDMQVFADLAELWERDMGGAHVACTTQTEAPALWLENNWFHPGPQLSVMLLDCERLDWDIDRIVADLDAGRYRYEDLLFSLCLVTPDKLDASLPSEWNHLERHEPGATKLVHYTVVPTQPWRSDDNPLEEVWIEAYQDAVESGTVPAELVEDHVARGWIKPALLDALKAAPAPRRPVRSSVAEVELDAALRRVDELNARSLRWRARRTAGRLAPLLRSTRGTKVGPVVQRAADVARRTLR